MSLCHTLTIDTWNLHWHPSVVSIARGPRGLYSALIVSEPCEGGFKATIPRVIMLLTKPGADTEVASEPFPEFVAESPAKAERKAEAFFKAWAKMQGL